MKVVGKAKTKYYVTVLSNLVRGLDKYSLRYSKSAIQESSFKNEFYLVDKSELEIGINKASQLLEKLNYDGNCFLWYLILS